MNRPADHDPPPAAPAACAPTMDRVQSVLDGLLPPDALAADPHATVCASCRARVRAACLLVATLDIPATPTWTPPVLTNAILAGVRREQRVRARRRLFARAAGLATAAAVVVAVWAIPRPPDRGPAFGPPPPEMGKKSPVTPGPTSPQGPAVHPLRLSDELAKAGDALRDSSRSLAEPAASAPKVFTALTDSLLKVPPAPAPEDLGASGQAFVEIPEAAKIGLEPVTGSAQKAFTRLMRDVGAMQPKAKS